MAKPPRSGKKTGKTHRYEEVARALTREIESGKIPVHGLFHSERDIARRYEISPLTVRKIYDILEGQSLIYRLHGKGTFVAPRSRRRRILVVLDLAERFDSRNYDRVDFFLGAMDACATASREHEVVAIKEAAFRAELPDLLLRYPNLAGILFFRNIDLVVEVQGALKALGVPFLFYGSNQHLPRLAEIPARLYDEAKITRLAMEHLTAAGRRRIGVAFIQAGASPLRLQRWREFLLARGLPAEDRWIFQARHFYGSFHQTLREIPAQVFRELDALYCTSDSFAVDAVQHLLAIGIRVPEEVAVVAVNHSPICLQIHPNLTTVSIPLFEDAQACLAKILALGAGKPGALHDESPVALLERQSG